MIIQLKNYIKNARGIKTDRKIIVFLVDDYGTIRISSNQALEKLQLSDPKISENRFNKYDAIANEDDLTALFDVLTSVKDKNGNSAVFTPMTVVSNPNFALIENNNFSEYKYETIIETFKQKKDGDKIIEVWKEGIDKNIFVPEFHGREHLNVRFWMDYLKKNDENVIEAFKHQSIGVHPSLKNSKGYMSAFDLENKSHLEEVIEVAKNGLEIFENLFGYKSILFTPSALIHNNGMHEELKKHSIELIDMARQRIEPMLNGKYKKRFHYMGQKNKFDQKYITRNVMFEPNKNEKDAVNQALKDIDVAFKYNKPAVISSHRVNFVGGKTELNRENGLKDLKKLLNGIITRWPDAEFLTIRDLKNIIR
jgi:hypothetical protein